MLPSACGKVPAAPAGLTPLANAAAPCHSAGCCYLRCRHQRVRKGARSASGPYISPVRCGAMPSFRTWSLPVLPSACAIRASSTCSCFGRALPYPGFGPGVSAHSAVVSACAKGQAGQQASQPLRALQHQDIAPDAITSSAAIGVWQQCLQHQQGLHLLRALQCHVIVPVGIVYSAAFSVRGWAGSSGGPYISHVRCGAMPSFRTWSPTVLPSAGAKRASSTSRPYLSYVRCRARPSCRR